MTLSSAEIWLVIALLAIGSFLIRFSFLGFVGHRPLPPWALRLLRYTPVAVLPGMVAPLVIWPDATGGETDPTRLIAAVLALAVGRVTGNVILAVAVGAGALGTGLYLSA